jgi:hypothetical protein
MSVHWPEMIDNQEKNTVFLKPLVTSPKIEVGEFTYYNDADDPAAFETRNVLYTAGPEKLIIGKFCAIATGAKFVVSDVAPYTTVGGNPARPLKKRYPDQDIDRLLRLAWWNWPLDVITEHVRTIWTGTPAELEQAAKDAGLLN